MKAIYRIIAILCPLIGIVIGVLLFPKRNGGSGPTIIAITVFFISLRAAKYFWWVDYKSPNEVDYKKKE